MKLPFEGYSFGWVCVVKIDLKGVIFWRYCSDWIDAEPSL